MTESQISLLQEAREFVTGLLTSKLSKSIRFHTLLHTQEVAAACERIAESIQLNDDDRFALAISAWFHDTGYISGQASNHETESIRLSTEFLTAHTAGAELISKVTGCINATRMPQNPSNIIEQIICDADLSHLGADAFKEKNRLLRAELIEFGGKELSKKEWREINIRFLEGHHYFTSYGREILQPAKEINLAGLYQKEKNPDDMKKDKHDKDRDNTEVKQEIKDKDKKKGKNKNQVLSPEAEEAKKKKEKEKEADRSIATIFRIMAQTQNNLSQMADSKANILISVNAIILSIIISSLFEKLQTDPSLQVPVAIIVLVCVVTIVFGILATRPNVSGGRFSRDDIAAKRTNLLFFGNFHNMSLDDYSWGMSEMLNDKYYMNNSMIKDAYFLGVVLAKKYRYLRLAYNIFMYGLVLAILAFLVAFLLPSATEVYI